MTLTSQRLLIVPATPASLRTELNDHPALSAYLNAVIPVAWPNDHPALSAYLNAVIPVAWPPENLRDALDFFAELQEAAPENTEWITYYWLSNAETSESRTLIGSGGFKGPPDETGTVEIGYGTLDEFQGKGYATEAVRCMTEWARSHPAVRTVIAEADTTNHASRRVLEKCGFIDIGEGSEPGLRRYRHHP